MCIPIWQKLHLNQRRKAELDVTQPAFSITLAVTIPYTSIMKVWTRLRNKAGLPHLRIHDLRHSFASFLVNSGRTLFEVQAILGHSQPIVTQRYAHLSTKTLQDASNSASVMIRGAMESSMQARLIAVDTVPALPAPPELAEVNK